MFQESIIASKWINILTGQLATTSAPTTSATAGIAVPNNMRGKNAAIRLRHTATGARTCTIKLFGYCAGEVDAVGAAIASSAYWDDLNESFSLTSTSTDGAICAGVFEALSIYSRIECQITAISGTSCTIAVAIAFTDEG